MVDQTAEFIPVDNTRSLLQVIADGMDDRLREYRKGTRYEGVRRSDVRVFVLALRQPRSMADIARILRVSRQAVHMSVKRLAALKIVALEAAPDNHRDKLVVLTDRGMTARQTAHTQVVMLENECRAALGPEGYATLRELLLKLEPSFVPDYAERRAHSDSNL